MRIRDIQKKEQKMGRTIMLLLGAAIAASFLACVFFVAGCGHDAANPLGPGSNGHDNDGLGALQLVLDNYGDPFDAALDTTVGGSRPQLGAGDWTLSKANDTAWVGKAGGTITLNFGNQTSTLTIPKDAVCSNGGSCVVAITASALHFNTPLGPVLLYDFGPNGLQFTKPCVLNATSDFAQGQVVRLFWFNPETRLWEFQQQVKVLQGSDIKFTVTHFSKYGIS